MAADHSGTPLGAVSPLAKLLVSLGWLVVLALTLRPPVPAVLAAIAALAAVLLGGVSPALLVRRIAPFVLAAIAIGASNAILGGGAAAGPELARVGPLRVTEVSAQAGLAIGLRVLTIALLAVVFAVTTDATRFVDALVQVAHAPERFAYGGLVGFGAVPRLRADLVTLQQARRIRGLGRSWSPDVLLSLLVLAIRHADRAAVAMDARAFGRLPRTHFRVERWRTSDSLFVAAGIALALAVLVALGR